MTVDLWDRLTREQRRELAGWKAAGNGADELAQEPGGTWLVARVTPAGWCAWSADPLEPIRGPELDADGRAKALDALEAAGVRWALWDCVWAGPWEERGGELWSRSGPGAAWVVAWWRSGPGFPYRWEAHGGADRERGYAPTPEAARDAADAWLTSRGVVLLGAMSGSSGQAGAVEPGSEADWTEALRVVRTVEPGAKLDRRAVVLAPYIDLVWRRGGVFVWRDGGTELATTATEAARRYVASRKPAEPVRLDPATLTPSSESVGRAKVRAAARRVGCERLLDALERADARGPDRGEFDALAGRVAAPKDARDPRTDPRAGDVLLTPSGEVVVIHEVGAAVSVRVVVPGLRDAVWKSINRDAWDRSADRVLWVAP